MELTGRRGGGRTRFAPLAYPDDGGHGGEGREQPAPWKPGCSIGFEQGHGRAGLGEVGIGIAKEGRLVGWVFGRAEGESRRWRGQARARPEGQVPQAFGNGAVLLRLGIESGDLDALVIGGGQFEITRDHGQKLIECRDETVGRSANFQREHAVARFSFIEDLFNFHLTGWAHGRAAGGGDWNPGRGNGQHGKSGGIEKIQIQLEWRHGVDLWAFRFQQQIRIRRDAPIVFAGAARLDFVGVKRARDEVKTFLHGLARRLLEFLTVIFRRSAEIVKVAALLVL